jgi:hypothetical protein
MTRHVRRVHDVPALGRDPFGWLEAALDVAVRRGADLLLPVQEQVTVMSLARDRIEAAGLATAVPAFAALAQVQDKVSAYRTLARAGLPQPAALVAATAAELEDARAPAFVKTPIGTASAGVRRALLAGGAQAARGGLRAAGRLRPGGRPGAAAGLRPAGHGPGGLRTRRARRVPRLRAGPRGHRGRGQPQARAAPAARAEHMAALGATLDWHGALSADMILGPEGPQFIDVNPRLVEPVNALASGVDLVRALMEVATSGTSRPQPDGQAGARTHQLLLAVLGAAQRGSRREVARELRDAALGRGSYRGSREELTPGRRDPLGPLPVAVTALTTLIRPGAWRHFTGGSTGAYSLTPAAWRQIR